MDQIKRLILGLIPNQKCNLKCEYCYISQLEAWDEPEKMKFSPDYIAKCLSKERLGGTCLINLTGNGETLLQPEIADITEALLKEGHYVEIVTNGTISKRIDHILEQAEGYTSHLFFKLSFHYKELKRLGIMDAFFDNVDKIKLHGASFTLELMAYDGIENAIDDIKELCVQRAGAVCQATIGRNHHKDADLLSQHSSAEFAEIWAPLNSPMMQLKLDMLNKKRKEFCYAGAWSLFLNLYTGETQPCYWQPYNQRIFDDPQKPIKFEPVGHSCTQPFCINAHAHMTWGLIPELHTPTYDVMRNRETVDGDEWLSNDCKTFFQTKLYQSNEEYTQFQKSVYSLTYPIRMVRWFFNDGNNNIARIKKHVIRKMKWEKNERRK